MKEKNGVTNLICRGVMTLLQIKQSPLSIIREYYCHCKNKALLVVENAMKCRNGEQ
jgi:hypothetical protein